MGKYVNRYYRIAAGFEKPKNALDRIAFRAWSSLGISPSKLQRCICDEYNRQLRKILGAGEKGNGLMDNVKGCPFCGSRCKLVEEWSDYTMEPGVQHPMKSRLIFGCPSCDCIITVEAEGEKSAVRIWQTRESTEFEDSE